MRKFVKFEDISYFFEKFFVRAEITTKKLIVLFLIAEARTQRGDYGGSAPPPPNCLVKSMGFSFFWGGATVAEHPPLNKKKCKPHERPLSQL